MNSIKPDEKKTKYFNKTKNNSYDNCSLVTVVSVGFGKINTKVVYIRIIGICVL